MEQEMHVYIIFGQRNEDYPEQYAPEALDCMDEFAYDANGTWLHAKLRAHEETKEFVGLKIMRVKLPQGAIREALIGVPTFQSDAEVV